jgi:hypothetical protein
MIKSQDKTPEGETEKRKPSGMEVIKLRIDILELE